jgi:hypothetical protein
MSRDSSVVIMDGGDADSEGEDAGVDAGENNHSEQGTPGGPAIPKAAVAGAAASSPPPPQQQQQNDHHNDAQADGEQGPDRGAKRKSPGVSTNDASGRSTRVEPTLAGALLDVWTQAP